jgi:arginine decarboxylase
MSWSIDNAREGYRVPVWGEGYIDIGDDGHLQVRPRRDQACIDLPELVERVHGCGLSLPVLVRFTDILRDRLDVLCDAFDSALQGAGAASGYTAIYPVKVNQQQHVIETLVAHGGERIGLECGSKPELLAVIGSLPDDGVIICNGYKDAEYVRIALNAQRLGHHVTLVVEKLSELDRILRIAAKAGVRPSLGLRVRLSSVTAGNWQNSGGDRSKFGFTAAGTLELLRRLRDAGRLDCLDMLHCHPGSQVTSIEVLNRALREVARTWVALREAGAEIERVDVGGGLGVDYEGRHADSPFSINYDPAQYAAEVVSVFAQAVEDSGLPMPHLMSESGRALTAHHAVLITNVIDTEQVLCEPAGESGDDCEAVVGLRNCLDGSHADNAVDSLRTASEWLALLRSGYLGGRVDLAQRAAGESLYYALCRRLQSFWSGMAEPPAEFDDINRRLADKYFCNLSIFQSMPDVWGIDQVFPVVPLQRLDEQPERRAVLHDLTCDSDGQVARYIDSHGIEGSLPVHRVRDGEPYLLGFFLLGAYQEILGDMHNLFGDTDAVNVRLDETGGYSLYDPRHGDTADELLRYVEFDTRELMMNYREKIARAGLPNAEAQDCMRAFDAALTGTTYMEDDD